LPTRRSFLTGSLSSLGWLAAGGAAAWFLKDRVFWPTPTTVEGPDSSGWLPFAAPARSLVTVTVGLNGAPVAALVDSGAQYTVVDRAFAEARRLETTLAPPLVAYGVGGGAQVGQGVTADLQVGALSVAGLKAATLNLGPITRAAGVNVPLILGQDLLSALAVDIDFPRRRVALRRPESVSLPEDAVSVPARRAGRAVHVQAAVEGRPIELLFDTGASGALSLTEAKAAELGLADRPSRRGSSVVLGGVAEARIIIAADLAFAGRVLEEVEVYLFPAPPVPGFPAGLLGVGAFRGDRIVLDCGRGRLSIV
jgi:predicted aspartyl protease